MTATQLRHLEEPVRRYLAHALAGRAAADGLRLTMRGRIDVGRRLAFTARQEFRGHAFEWRARAGWGPLKPLHVVDSYRPGAGQTEARLLGLVPFLRASGEDTTRAAAGRAAAESIWVPGTLLPERGVAWRVQGDDHIVARVPVPPEEPELHIRIGDAGAVRTVAVMRWGNAGQEKFGYIPFGGHVHAERRFGALVLPSRVTVGWWFGTPRYRPFFEATVVAAEPLD